MEWNSFSIHSKDWRDGYSISCCCSTTSTGSSTTIIFSQWLFPTGNSILDWRLQYFFIYTIWDCMSSLFLWITSLQRDGHNLNKILIIIKINWHQKRNNINNLYLIPNLFFKTPLILVYLFLIYFWCLVESIITAKAIFYFTIHRIEKIFRNTNFGLFDCFEILNG